MKPGHALLSNGRRVNGFMLIDCLAYISLLLLLLAMAFLTFYRVLDHSKSLHRSVADVSRALHAGERWRADVRAAVRPPRLEQVGAEAVLHLPQGQGEVLYTFREGTVLRKSTAGPAADWQPFLPDVQASQMSSDRRQKVIAWRWELELAARKTPRTKPCFTFQAVARQESAP